MPLPSGFKTKEEYAKYMREYRERKRAEREKKDAQLKEAVKIAARNASPYDDFVTHQGHTTTGSALFSHLNQIIHKDTIGEKEKNENNQKLG